MKDKIINMYFATHKTCNLNCSYCYIPEFNRFQKKVDDKRIIESLNRFIRKVENEDYKIGAFCFHGTESTLMSPETLAVCVNLIKNHWQKNNQSELTAAIQTNGVNLTKDYFSRLLKYISPKDLKIGFSIDPPKILHNKFRNNSWDIVEENYNLAQSLGFKVSVLSVVTKETMLYLEEFSEWMKAQLSKKEKYGNPYKIKIKFATGRESFEPSDFVDFADFLIKENLLSLPQILTPGYCIQKGNECMWFEFDIEGNCYSCNKTYDDDGVFANWNEESFQKIFDKRKKLYNLHFVNDECSKCEFEFLCNSGCPIDRWKTGKLKGKAHECLLVKKVYNYIINNEKISLIEFYNKNN